MPDRKVLMFTRDFLVDLAERAVRAFAWSVLSFFGAADVLDAFHADWWDALGVGLGAAVLSVLASVAAYGAGSKGTASLTEATVPASALAEQAARYGRHAAGLKDGPA